MTRSIGTKIGGGFALALAMFLVVGTVSYRSTIAFVESSEWVTHTHKVREKLQELLSKMTDAETGQRGYVITGEERYLEPYRGAIEAVSERLSELRKLTADNSNQQRRLDALDPLIKDKFDELRETIDVRKSKGFEAALKLVLLDRGKRKMDEVRKVIGEMDNEENELLRQRSDEENGRARGTEISIIVGSFFGLALVTIAGFLITRNISVPLRGISGAAQKIALGDLAVPVSSDSRGDEVGVLAKAFAGMTTSLQELARGADKIALGDLTV